MDGIRSRWGTNFRNMHPNMSQWGRDMARQRYMPNLPSQPTAPGLPPQAAPQAAAALAARPAMPTQAAGMQPFKRGGKAC